MFRLGRYSLRCNHVFGYLPELTICKKFCEKQPTPGKIICRLKSKNNNIHPFLTPVPVETRPSEENVGAEFTGEINKSELIKILNAFYQKKELKILAAEHGLDGKWLYELQ